MDSPSNPRGVYPNLRRKSKASSYEGRDLQIFSEFSRHQSNIFKMELEEMLSQVKLDYQSRMAPVEKVLHLLKTVIEDIPERLQSTIADVEGEMKQQNIHVPFPDPRPTQETQYKFSYAKPACINVVGGYAMQTNIKDDPITLDVVLTIPPGILQDKDYLNFRYFHKRAYYLAFLASHLASHELTQRLKFHYDYVNDDPLRPVLVISPSEDGTVTDFRKSDCKIQILPSTTSSYLSSQKISPSKCLFKNTPGLQNDNMNRIDSYQSFYKSSLAADSTYFPYSKFLHNTSQKCTAFTEACILGRVWLRQRGFGSSMGTGGFGHFEWSLLMAFLLTSGTFKGSGSLSTGYSNYQLFKATVQFLASRDLSMDPLLIGQHETMPLRRSGNPIIFDGNHNLNVLFKMSPWSYAMLRHEANITLQCLSSNVVAHQFDAVFLYRSENPHFRFDAVASIPVSVLSEQKENIQADAIQNLQILHKMYHALKKGLGDRCSMIHFSCSLSNPLSLAGQLSVNTSSNLTIGFLLNEATYDRKTDRGPPPEESKNANAFRKFWGTMAELRRFPDGSILESVTWHHKGIKTPVYQQIIRYIIERHVSCAVAESVIFFDHGINDKFIEGIPVDSSPFHLIDSAYASLENDLKSLSGLPLALRHISPAGCALRFSTVEVPSIGHQSSLHNPIDVIVQFESSGRWPDDLVAVQYIKLSLLIRVGALLEQAKHTEVISRLGIENSDNRFKNMAFLDIVYLSGLCFRIRVYHEEELDLLGRTIQNQSNSWTKALANSALADHRRAFVQGPRHTQLIRKLCHRYQSMSPTMRLVRKWFNSHMLSSHIQVEVIELIVAHIYLQPYPWTSPATATAGLLRTLHFLANWDWRTEPLIVDLTDGDLNTARLDEINQIFRDLRKRDPGISSHPFYVATNYDTQLSSWTENGPKTVVAVRITSLARSTLHYINNGNTANSTMNLFRPSLQDYDFILHLNPKYLQSGKQLNKGSRFKNLNVDDKVVKDVTNIGLDVIGEYFTEISKLFSNTTLFFRDETGNCIGGIWYPIPDRGWKPSLEYSTTPSITKEATMASINKTSILSEIARIGDDLITSVQIKQ